MKTSSTEVRLRLSNKLVELLLQMKLYGEAVEYAQTALDISVKLGRTHNRDSPCFYFPIEICIYISQMLLSRVNYSQCIPVRFGRKKQPHHSCYYNNNKKPPSAESVPGSKNKCSLAIALSVKKY